MSNVITVDSGSFEEQDRAMPQQRQSFFEKLGNIVSISQFVRAIGATAIIASMSLFMLQGWSEGNDITRYLKLLGQTGLLTTVGLILSFIVKEYKGARVFFGLSLFSVVANFTILGALTFSMVQWDSSLIDYPSMMKWVVVDPATFMGVFGGAALLLAVVSRFSFSIFARHIAGRLTLYFLLMCALLLIPVRSSLVISLLAGASLFVATQLVKSLSSREKVVMTLEAKFAMGMLFLPATIMILRAISLYHIDEILLTGLCGLAYSLIRFWVARVEEDPWKTHFLAVTQYAIGICFAFLLIDLLPSFPFAYHGFLVSALISLLVLDQLSRSSDESWKSWALNITAFGLVFINLWIAVFDSNITWKISSLAVSLTVFITTWRAKEFVKDSHFAWLSANIGIAASVLLLITRVIELINMSNWMLIGITGVVLIVGASLYERYGLSLSAMKLKSKE